VRTKGGRLNVRRAPQGSVIGGLENGSAVEILSESGGWMRIAFDGGEGYVSEDYVERKVFTGARIRIIDEAGNLFIPEGNFTISTGEID